MHNQPLTVISWPHAIVHIDGDCFFASVEQALNPALRDKPLVTGFERGIASAMSKEAKSLGITRGMPIGLIKRNFPECIVVPGNYEAYLAFARRMFTIMRRYTPIVEEYSIDEGFADITGLRRILHKSYKDIGLDMQTAIEKELDITVSVGVSLTKSLAKLCSKFRKPHGLTCVKGQYIHILLQRTPINKVWGIGENISAFLRKHGCYTAYDFVNKPLPFIKKYMTKKELEIYKELRGEAVYEVDPNKKNVYKTISKTKTFEPTVNRDIIFAHLAKNIEDASAKCRRYRLAPKKLLIALKTQGFIYHGQGAVLNRPSAGALELIKVAERLFELCYRQNIQYRSTLCVMASLTVDENQQLNIFESPLAIEKMENLSLAIDQINHDFGYGTIHCAASIPARGQRKPQFAVPMLEISV
ncbi:MAG: DNA polymerase IV [Candidatus Margulisiibacteriota bacterium]